MGLASKIVLGSCLFAEATANFVSPGLNKCLDLQAELNDDGERETLKEMMEDEKTNVQLYECHSDHNQRFLITNGQFRSFSMEGFCLTAAEIEDNADVHLEKCVEGNDKQLWDLTGNGNVQVTGSEKCLDVKAALKDDGTRENWEEIQKHKTVNVHLYKCHDPEKTERVNQLWGWTPYKHGKPVTAKIGDIVQMAEIGEVSTCATDVSEAACKAAAEAGGLNVGTTDHPFAGVRSETGCFAYLDEGTWGGTAYYGYLPGGGEVTNPSQLTTMTNGFRYRIQVCQVCKLGTQLRFNSHSRRTLKHGNGGEVGLDMEHGTKSEFTLSDAGDAKYFITNSEGKHLTDDIGVLKFVNNTGLWESWRISDAGSGQSFVQSHRGYFLGDLRGFLHLHSKADFIDEWWVHDIEGKPACTVAQ